MFNDKKLRNTFLLALFGFGIPVCYLFGGTEISASVLNWIDSAILVGGMLVCVYALVKLFKSWKTWNRQLVKVAILILGFAGILLNAYVILVIYALYHWYH
ncbi:MAG TPA: hypothetical protein VK809_05980 [Bacteroidia bacterium]|jgi:hypothetical protein|nr:hypothetical protein [Bacteroidia bacterium]